MRIISFALLTLALLLSACGQKGPLYLPQDSSPAAATPTEPADEADRENRKQSQ